MKETIKELEKLLKVLQEVNERNDEIVNKLKNVSTNLLAAIEMREK